MNKRNTTLSIAAVIAAAGLALQAPVAGAADDEKSSASGVPGVEMNVGDNASDRGLPGVEANVGRDGDQNNIDTQTLGAGADTGTGTTTDDDSTMRPLRADRG